MNRRLAPDVYLGVEEMAGPDGAHEPAVVMRRMPDDRRLAQMVASGVDVHCELRTLAHTLAAFHERACTGPDVEQAGLPGAVRGKWLAILNEMRAFVPSLFLSTELDHASTLALDYLEGRAELFASRIRAGRIRDGHGDLLADDIFCLDDGPRILDCLEFDDALRFTDVLEDVASLAMDLERLGRPDLAVEFLAAYAEFSGDRYPPSLADFFIAYRCLVRAKVAAIRWTQGAVGAVDEARGLLQLALTHLHQGTVHLVVVGGLPGAGKSTLAGALADRHGWCLLRSDLVRKEVSGTASELAGYGEGRYSSEITECTYGRLLGRAALLLAMGETVVLDASWQSRRRREEATRVAGRAHAQLVEIELAVLDAEANDRLRRRAGSGDPSEATPEVLTQMAAEAEPWPSAIRLDGDRSPGMVLGMAEALLSA